MNLVRRLLSAGRVVSGLRALVAALVLLLVVPSVSGAAACSAPRWLGAWEAPPSDASQGTSIEDQFAPSEEVTPGDKKLPVSDATVRAVLTPTFGGSTVRVHLSNRFGSGPVTFMRVTIGKQSSGAALAGKPAPLTFGGGSSVTVPASQDVVSDPVSFSYQAFQTLAVSVYVAGNAGFPTEHYTGRQASYFTSDGAGDHSSDATGAAFTLNNSTRPFVDGIDVLAPSSAGAVVAFGDSITDGFQGQPPAGVPANPQGYNQNRRWPDDFARRLVAAHIPLSVLNAGISGNRVLLDGTAGGGPDVYGPAALTRLGPDVLDKAGVTTVIWLEGINDIGQTPTPTVAQLINGYKQGIARMHAAGLRVVMGTLTPAGGNPQGNYGTAQGEAMRQQVNQWIRTQKLADGVIDFDKAVRDPADPSRINPAYDGGDHLHFNPAGYQVMADGVNLALLRRAGCPTPTLRLSVTPSTVRLGRRIMLRFRVIALEGGRAVPVPAAAITIAGHLVRSGAQGRARVSLRFTHVGRAIARVTALGFRPGTASITVARRQARPSFTG
jgi:lysophospholipase L1-like esterase